MLLNRALFAQNGGVGFVLKPLALRTDDESPKDTGGDGSLRASGATGGACVHGADKGAGTGLELTARGAIGAEAEAEATPATQAALPTQSTPAQATQQHIGGGCGGGGRGWTHRGSSPALLRSSSNDTLALGGSFSLIARSPPQQQSPVLLSIRVLSAHNLPKTADERVLPERWDEYPGHSGYWNGARLGNFPQVNFDPDRAPTAAGVVSPACEVELIGGCVSEEGSDAVDERWARTTSVVINNGLNPSWSNEEPSRVAVWAPQLTFLRISVYNCRPTTLGGLIGGLVGQSRRVLLAHEAVPVCVLRPGFRSMQLRAPSCGNLIESCALLLEIGVTPIADDAPPPRAPRGLSCHLLPPELGGSASAEIMNRAGSSQEHALQTANSRNSHLNHRRGASATSLAEDSSTRDVPTPEESLPDAAPRRLS